MLQFCLLVLNRKFEVKPVLFSGPTSLLLCRSLLIWGAFQHFEEQIKGTLEPGKVADMVVLERNPLKTPPEDLIDISVAATVKGGEVIYNPGVLDIKGS
jgi:hypothetical protein